MSLCNCIHFIFLNSEIFILNRSVVKRVMPRTVGKLLGCWQEKFGWSESSKILRAVTLCLMWKIWNGIIVGLLKLDFLPL